MHLLKNYEGTSSAVGEATLEREVTENQNGDCNRVFNS